MWIDVDDDVTCELVIWIIGFLIIAGIISLFVPSDSEPIEKDLFPKEIQIIELKKELEYLKLKCEVEALREKNKDTY